MSVEHPIIDFARQRARETGAPWADNAETAARAVMRAYLGSPNNVDYSGLSDTQNKLRHSTDPKERALGQALSDMLFGLTILEHQDYGQAVARYQRGEI